MMIHHERERCPLTPTLPPQALIDPAFLQANLCDSTFEAVTASPQHTGCIVTVRQNTLRLELDAENHELFGMNGTKIKPRTAKGRAGEARYEVSKR